MTMSCEGVASGFPCAGESTLLEESMRMRASACASAESGRCTAIWSPSKSALKAWQTSGWIWIALPSTSTGSNAWMPRRWSVGARFRSTGCSAMTSSSTSQTSPDIESTYFLAALMFCTDLRSTRRLMMNGLKSSSAISFGKPHWCSLSVGRLLEHALLVVDDDLGRAQVEQALEPVVPVDDAPVEVVQVARGEAAAVELHHRSELGRDHRHGLEHHPFRTVLRGDERVHDLEALDRTLLLLALGGLDRLPERARLGVEVEVTQELADRLRAHAALEVDPEAVRRAEAVLQLAEEHLVVDDQLWLEVSEELPGLLEPGDRVERGLTRVLAPGLHVLVHLPNLQRPLEDRVVVALLHAALRLQAEVARELAYLLGRLVALERLEQLGEQPVAEAPGLLQVLEVDAGDELGVLALEGLAREQGVLDPVDVLRDGALLGAGRLVSLLRERRERIADLHGCVRHLVELAAREVAIGPDGRLPHELAKLLRVLGRDLAGHLDEEAPDEAASLLERGQALLLGPGREAARPELVVLVEVPLLRLGEVLAPAGQPALERGERLVPVDEDALALGAHLVLEVGQVGRTLLDLDLGDDRGGEVEDLLELLGSDVEEVADTARHALEEPDVRDRRGEVDVAHALAAHLLARDLDAAALADDALIADALVLAAVALPVLRRTED